MDCISKNYKSIALVIGSLWLYTRAHDYISSVNKLQKEYTIINKKINDIHRLIKSLRLSDSINS